MTYILVVGGLILLFIGGEALVRGSVSVARKLNISEVVIGLTLVGFGTSMPELVTSLQAVSVGSVGLAVGNVVGSNIANIFLVLAIAALIAPISVQPASLARDGTILIAATLLMCGLFWFDEFGRIAGTALIASLIVYLAVSLSRGSTRTDVAPEIGKTDATLQDANYGLVVGLVLVVVGIAALIFGAGFLVTGAADLARSQGVDEVIIGLTVVAIGTSLPELATALVAVSRKRGGIALGTVIGSNIFNALGILGITALVHPFSVHGDASAAALAGGQPVSMVSYIDVGALILSAGLLMLFAMTGRKIARWEGAVLLLGYAIYIGLTFGLIPQVELISRGG